MERTIKSFVNAITFEKIDADTFFAGSEEKIHLIRRKMTEEHLDGEKVHVCGKCGCPVYVAFDSNRQGYLKHYTDDVDDCPWYTGEPSSPDSVDAARFQGRQESALHKRLKSHIANLLSSDSQCKVLGVDQIFKGELTEGYRRPDVFAEFGEYRIAFEVQLATTQMPTLVGKEEFYRKNGIYICWVFWDFESISDRVSAKDTFYYNKENAFSLDREAIEEGIRSGRLKLRAHWRQPTFGSDGELSGVWRTKLIGLTELSWDQKTLKPFIVDVPAEKQRLEKLLEEEQEKRRQKEHRDRLLAFERAWFQRNEPGNRQHMNMEEILLEPIWRHIDQGSVSGLSDSDWYDFGRVLDRLYSLREGRTIGSREKNLVATVNTALENWPDYTSYLIDVAKAYGRHEVLARETVQKKIERNLKIGRKLESFSSRAERLIGYLFPEYKRTVSHKAKTWN
jgi:hypothetical protein